MNGRWASYLTRETVACCQGTFGTNMVHVMCMTEHPCLMCSFSCIWVCLEKVYREWKWCLKKQRRRSGKKSSLFFLSHRDHRWSIFIHSHWLTHRLNSVSQSVTHAGLLLHLLHLFLLLLLLPESVNELWEVKIALTLLRLQCYPLYILCMCVSIPYYVPLLYHVYVYTVYISLTDWTEEKWPRRRRIKKELELEIETVSHLERLTSSNWMDT